MTWEQILEALKALGELTVGFRAAGDWYVAVRDVEVKDGGMLRSRYGNGRTPELAAQDCWAKLIHLKPDQYLVIGASSDRRRAVRWNGFMWADLAEDYPSVHEAMLYGPGMEALR